EDAWTRVSALMNAAPPRVVGAHKHRRSPAHYALAAALLIAAGLSTVPRLRRVLTLGPSAATPRAIRTRSREFSTQRGQRAEIRLNDGTRVILAAESRIVVPPDFDSTARLVTLTGQASFDVVHNAARPFIVRAGAALIRDIGTRFDVRAYDSV